MSTTASDRWRKYGSGEPPAQPPAAPATTGPPPPASRWARYGTAPAEPQPGPAQTPAAIAPEPSGPSRADRTRARQREMMQGGRELMTASPPPAPEPVTESPPAAPTHEQIASLRFRPYERVREPVELGAGGESALGRTLAKFGGIGLPEAQRTPPPPETLRRGPTLGDITRPRRAAPASEARPEPDPEAVVRHELRSGAVPVPAPPDRLPAPPAKPAPDYSREAILARAGIAPSAPRPMAEDAPGVRLRPTGHEPADAGTALRTAEEAAAALRLDPLLQLGRGLASGTLGLAESVGAAAQWAGSVVGSEALERAGREAADFWEEHRERFAMPEELRGSIVDNPRLVLNPAWLAYMVGETAPSVAASMIPGVAAQRYLIILGERMLWSPELVARLARLGAATAGGLAGGSLEGTSTYREVLARGGTDEQAALAGMMMTLASAGLNALSVDVALRPGRALSAKRFLLTGSTEGLTEYLEEPAEVGIKLGVLDREQFAREEAREQLKHGANVIPAAFITGGIAGTAGAAAADAATTRRDRADREIARGLDALRSSRIEPGAHRRGLVVDPALSPEARTVIANQPRAADVAEPAQPEPEPTAAADQAATAPPGDRSGAAQQDDPSASEPLPEAAVPSAAPAPPLRPGQTGTVPANEIDLEPERFQFKLGTGAQGVTRQFENVRQWNPNLAGVVAVWRDPDDGRLKVVNGHHRVELARRLNVPQINVIAIDAADESEARTIGAMINIAEGRGTPLDAAKLFRELDADRETLQRFGVPLTESNARDGLAIARLPQALFQEAVTGRLPVQRASLIGGSALTDAQMLSLAQMLEAKEERGRALTNAQVRELIRFVRDAGEVDVSQETLFGEETLTQSLAVEKAELSAYVKDRLGKERRLFGFLTRGQRAEDIRGAGAGQIDVDRASEIATGAAQAEEIYNRLSTMSGPVAQALNDAARELAQGGRRSDIQKALYERVRTAVEAELEALAGGARADSAADVRGAPGGPEGSRGTAEPAGVAGDIGERPLDVAHEDSETGSLFAPAPTPPARPPGRRRRLLARRGEAARYHGALDALSRGEDVESSQQTIEELYRGAPPEGRREILRALEQRGATAPPARDLAERLRATPLRENRPVYGRDPRSTGEIVTSAIGAETLDPGPVVRPGRRRILQRMGGLIRQIFEQPDITSVGQWAARNFLSTRAFVRRFTDAELPAPTEFLQLRRILRVVEGFERYIDRPATAPDRPHRRRIRAANERTYSQIVAELGEDPFSISNAFLRLTGLRPREVRRRGMDRVEVVRAWLARWRAEPALTVIGKAGRVRRRRRLGLPQGVDLIVSEPYTKERFRDNADFTAAKQGDVEAAVRFVQSRVRPRDVQRAREQFGTDVVYVSPITSEALGANAVPMALAEYYAAATGTRTHLGIVQAIRAGHSGTGQMDRLIVEPLFRGPVEAGTRYVLVDDVTTSGSTLAALADYIRRRGGEVVGAVTLASGSRTGKLSPDAESIKHLDRRFGNVIREEFGIEPAALTADEVRYLGTFRDAQQIRDRAAQARAKRAERLRSQGVRPPAAGGSAGEVDAVREPAPDDPGRRPFTHDDHLAFARAEAERLGVPFHAWDELARSEAFRRWGIPNALPNPDGTPHFGASSGALFIDDETGRPVAVVGPRPTDALRVREAVPQYGHPLNDTAVVDEAGQPKVVYHGTGAAFASFDPLRSEPDTLLFGSGIYFTEDPEIASGYARPKRHDPGYPSDEELATYFQPGRIVPSYGGRDIVLEFYPRGLDGRSGWAVRVRAVDQDGEPIPGERERVHYTAPSHQALVEAGIRIPAPNVRPARLAIRNPFRVDAPATEEMVRPIIEAAQRAADSTDLADSWLLDREEARIIVEELPSVLRGQATGQEVYYDLLHLLESKEAVNALLQLAGYDGITHIGGIISGGKRHRVWIAFQREQVFGAFGPYQAAMRVGEPHSGYDLFGEEVGAPGTETEEKQGALFEQPPPARGLTEAEREARTTVSALEGKVRRGAASKAEKARYEAAVALLRRNEKISADEIARARRDDVEEPPSLPGQQSLFEAIPVYPEAMQRSPEQARRARREEERIAFGSAAAARAVLQRVRRYAGDQLELALEAMSDVAARAREARSQAVASAARRVQSALRNVRLDGLQLTTAEDVARALAPFRDPRMELVHVLFVTDRGEVLGHRIVTSGAIDYVSFDRSFIDEIGQQATGLGATGVILAHNHPSGDPTPSPEDVDVTATAGYMLQGRGIHLYGQLVLDSEEFSFIRPMSGAVSGSPVATASTYTPSWMTWEKLRADLGEDYRGFSERMFQPEQLARVAAAWGNPDRSFDVVYANTQLEAVALRGADLADLDSMADWIVRDHEALASTSAFIATRDARVFERLLAWAREALVARGTGILDMLLMDEQGRVVRSSTGIVPSVLMRSRSDVQAHQATLATLRVQETTAGGPGRPADSGRAGQQSGVRGGREAGRDREAVPGAEAARGGEATEEVASPEELPTAAGTARPADPVSGAAASPAQQQAAAAVAATLTTPPASRRGRPVSAPQVIHQLARITAAAYETMGQGGRNVAMRTGRVPKWALGVFKVRPEVIRTKKANDIGTAAHEVAHALEKIVYGWPKRGPWWKPRVTPGMQKELVRLGRLLYPHRVPAGGYRREGFAEYVRMWVTEEGTAEAAAPLFTTWFEGTFLTDFPAVARELEAARRLARRFYDQDVMDFVEASIVDTSSVPSRARAVARMLRGWFSIENMVEVALPLHDLVRKLEQRGIRLAPEDDPWITTTALRLTHSSRARYAVETAMIDLAGNRVGRPLSDAAQLVKGMRREFLAYLWARRGLALLDDPRGPRDPGLTREQAREIIRRHDSPQFRQAASIVYEWNDGVLNYAAQASPTFAEIVERIRARDPGHYVPLQREFEEMDAAWARTAGATKSSPVKRLFGSGRRIKDPFESMIAKAEATFRAAHQRVVIEQIIRISQLEGVGELIEEVEPDRVPVARATFQQLVDAMNRKLLDADPNTKLITLTEDGNDPDLLEQLTFFAPAQRGRAGERIVMVRDQGRLRWFVVQDRLYTILQGMDVYRLPKVLDLLFGVPARTFRAGTTGLRASFGLWWNMLRDAPTFYVQTQSSANPAELLAAWSASMAEGARLRLTGKSSDWLDLYLRLGGEMALPLGQDIPHTRRAARRLFAGRLVRTIDPRNWYDWYRDLVQFPELAPRNAELRLLAKDVSWQPGMLMTFGQSLGMLNGLKQVTTDFTAAGAFGRVMNQMVPFFNAAIQGPRATIRAARRDPARVTFRIAQLAIASLALYWTQKDDDWYRKLAYRDRFLFWHFPFDNPITGQKELARIPRPFEVGMIAAMPEAILDAWYREDPRAATQWFHTFVDVIAPPVTPVLLKVGAEQLANRQFFFDRPIVPEGEQRKPVREQFNEYTTRAAVVLGDIFNASPRRIDHAIHGTFGPVSMDLLPILGMGPAEMPREKELADLPIIGRSFVRGGQALSRPKPVQDLYEAVERAQLRQHSDRETETATQRQQRLQLEDAASAITALGFVRTYTSSTSRRRELTQAQSEIAEQALAAHGRGLIDRERFASRRRSAEAMKEQTRLAVEQRRRQERLAREQHRLRLFGRGVGFGRQKQ